MDYIGKKVVIGGAGIMGASIAQVYAKAEFLVTIYDLNDELLNKGRDLIKINQETMVKEGMISESGSQALMNRISYSCDKNCFRDVFLVVESIIEKIEIKHSFWEEVSSLVPADALLATNTSGLSISKIAAKVKDPSRFGGQHWLNPPHLIPVCEIIRGDKTSDDTMLKLKELTEYLGKKPVVLNRDIPGFVINRIQFAVLREALSLVESGAVSLEDVDNVMKYGMGLRYACLGPFEIADLGGLDTFDSISSYLFADLADNKERSALLHGLVEKGSLGVKAKKGFYDYSDGRDQETIRHRDQMFIKLAKCLYE